MVTCVKVLEHFCRLVLLSALMVTFTSCSHSPPIEESFDQKGFEQLLNTLATGWNTNNARLAASVFEEDAIYSEPPDKQLYKGRKEIYEFFGGDEGRQSQMTMRWHHISFDSVKSVGSGEFTFGWPGGNVHGMVSIRIVNGQIKNWREYYYESPSRWEEFSSQNQF